MKLSDTLRDLNTKYGIGLSYQRLYLDVVAGNVPAERDVTGRFWDIAEADQPRIAKFYGFAPVKKAKPAGKPKPAAVKPARSRTTRSAA
jgi:hypothetical protein